MNWGNLDDGEHTAVAYDNGVEFARSTFTVVRASEEEPFLRDVVAECMVPDFPDAGTNARFEWSTGTQHLELVKVGEDVVVPVSTQFDGEYELTFKEIGSPYGVEPERCRELVGAEFNGRLEVRGGIAVDIQVEALGTSKGVDWYANILPDGILEGSWSIELEGDYLVPWLTLGSWDGLLDRDEGGGN